MIEDDDLSCPLCSLKLYFFQGSVDNSGVSKLPFTSCECGFTFSPNAKVTGSVGDSGWDIIRKQHEEVKNNIIKVIKRGSNEI